MGCIVPKRLGKEISVGLLTTYKEHPPRPEGELRAPAPSGRPHPVPDEPPAKHLSSIAGQTAQPAAEIAPSAAVTTSAPQTTPVATAVTTPTAATTPSQRPGIDIVSLMRSHPPADEKYSGKITDCSALKLNIFYHRCRLGEIAEPDIFPGMSITLRGTALSFFYNDVKTRAIDFERDLALIRDHFVTPESTRALLSEYTLSLHTVMLRSPGLPATEALQIMLSRFECLRPCLPVEYRGNFIYCNRLYNACRDV